MRKHYFLLILLPLTASLIGQRPEVKPFKNIIIGSSGAALYENMNSDPALQPIDYWDIPGI